MIGFAFTRLVTGVLGLFVPVVLARAMPLEAYADYLLILSAAMLAITLGSFGYDRAAYRFLPPLVAVGAGPAFARLASLLAGGRIVGACVIAVGLALAGDVLPAFGVTAVPGGGSTIVGLVAVFAWSEAAGVMASALSRHRMVALVGLFALAGRAAIFAALLLTDRSLSLDRVLQITLWTELAQASVLSWVIVSGIRRLTAPSGLTSSPVAQALPAEGAVDGQHVPQDLETVMRCCLGAWGAYIASMPTQGPALRLVVGAFADTHAVAAFGFFQQLADRARSFLPLQLVLSNIETALSARRSARPGGDPAGLRALAVMTRLNLVLLALGLVALASAGTELEHLLTAGRFAGHLDLAALIVVQLMLASIGSALWTAYNATGDAVLLNRCSMLASAASVPVVIAAAATAGALGVAAVSSIRVVGLCLLLVRRQGGDLVHRLLACPREVRAHAVTLTAMGVALLVGAGLRTGGVSGFPVLVAAWTGFGITAALLKWITPKDLSSIGRLTGRPADKPAVGAANERPNERNNERENKRANERNGERPASRDRADLVLR